MSESETKTLQQSLRETWLGILGVFSQAESEVLRASNRLFDLLGRSDGSTEVEGEAPAPRHPLTGELLHRMRQNQAAFERRVDEAVRAAVVRICKPLGDELAQMRARLEMLQRRLDALQQQRHDSREHPDSAAIS